MKLEMGCCGLVISSIPDPRWSLTNPRGPKLHSKLESNLWPNELYQGHIINPAIISQTRGWSLTNPRGPMSNSTQWPNELYLGYQGHGNNPELICDFHCDTFLCCASCHFKLVPNNINKIHFLGRLIDGVHVLRWCLKTHVGPFEVKLSAALPFGSIVTQLFTVSTFTFSIYTIWS